MTRLGLNDMHEPLLLRSFDCFLLGSVEFLILKLCDQASEFFLESLGSSSRNWTRGYGVSLTTTLLESLRSQNNQFRDRFRQTCYKDLVFARGDFLSVVGAQNESLRIILMYYVQILIWDQNNFARVTSEPKYPIQDSIQTNQL